jgi:predicted TIM-barrel fold metal-dependent hydrolase
MTSHSRERRAFLKQAGLGAAAAAVAASAATTPEPAKAAVEDKKTRKKYKVIDWRCRPPLKPYQGLYKLRIDMANRSNTVNAPASFGAKLPKSINMVDKPGGMEQWWKELDAAGVDAAVANGRYGAGLPQFSMDNATLVKLQKQYPGRFYGLSALNLDLPIEQTVKELEEGIKNGLRGANIEPGYRTKNGGATTIDNADFYPIFETMIAADLPLMVQTGAFAGIYDFNDANQMWRFDAVMGGFPKLKLLLAHGGYPRITEVLALGLKHPNLFICSDCYTFWPGGQLYQQNIDMLQDQFVYGSAFPFANADLALQETLKLPLSDTVRKKYLYENAAALLKL